MGWYYQNGRGTHAEIDAELQVTGRCYLTGAMRHHWHAGRTADGTTFIALELIDRQSDGTWGYKPIDESTGPSALDVPAALLAAVPDPRMAYSTEWRASVAESLALREAIKAAPVGSIISTGRREYRIVRKGASLVCTDGRTLWRVPRTHITAVYPAEVPE